MRFAIDIQSSRQEFDLVTEQAERHRAGQVSEVFKLHFAERRRFPRTVEGHRCRRISRRFPGKNDFEVRNAQLWMIDDDRRIAGRFGRKCHLPRAASGAQVLVQGEARGVDGDRQCQRTEDVLSNATRLHLPAKRS